MAVVSSCRRKIVIFVALDFQIDCRKINLLRPLEVIRDEKSGSYRWNPCFRVIFGLFLNKAIPREVRNYMLELTARKNQKLIVSDRQLNILVGCLLGDAYIHPRGQIQIAQTSKQFPYVMWKYEELKSLAYGLPTKVERFDKRYSKSYSQTRFWLRQYFRSWREIFYPKG